MDTTSTPNNRSNPTKYTASPTVSADPFHTLFDDEQEQSSGQEDEWWNDEDDATAKNDRSAAVSRLTQWPALETPAAKDNGIKKQTGTRKPPKRYSVQKPLRYKSKQRHKKQNILAGIKVVTDFSKSTVPTPFVQQVPAHSQLAHISPQVGVGQFVDLAALQALESQAPGNEGWLWKSIMDMLPSKGESFPRIQHPVENTEESSIERLSDRKCRENSPIPLTTDFTLSPDDRPIVIGITIPSERIDEHALSPQTATSETSKIIQSYGNRTPNDENPETPTIVITTAQDSSILSALQRDSGIFSQTHRAASSVYSRAISHAPGVPAAADAPPLPQMPAYAMKANKELTQNQKHPVRESFGTVFSDDVEWISPTTSRVMSSCTFFEEDESPILARKGRVRSVSDASKHTSVITGPNHRQSKGWWNIMTPFLTRSNTLASLQTATQQRPALPNLETAALKAQEMLSSKWEKTFSPVTPFTSTTIASDAWWDKQSPSGPVANPFKRTVSEAFAAANGHQYQKSADESGTLEFMLAINTHQDNDVTRGPSTRTIGTTTSALSLSDREAPLILAHSNSQLESQARPQINDDSQQFQTHAPRVIDVFPEPPRAVTARPLSIRADSPQPPPYSPPRPSFPRYRAVLPPGHVGHQSNRRQPPEPGPLSPGLQQAMSSREGIALSDVPLTPTASRRAPIKLNSAYPGLPANPRVRLAVTASDLGMTSEKARKAEAKRRRHEREDAIAHRAGGLWRGRGCIPKRGCYGRKGAEGRRRRRVWFCLIVGFLTMIILCIVLATTLHRRPSQNNFPSQWLNLTGFPPIFTGVSTVATPDNTVTNTGCVFPATVWSCSLPKEQQHNITPSQDNQPNFRFNIQWDNSSAANATFVNVTGNPNLPVRSLGGNAASAGNFIKRLLLGRQFTNFVPSPTPPPLLEQFFLGNTTDGIVSRSKAGEPTPFYITLMTSNSVLGLSKRTTTNSSSFPDIASFIPPPDNNPDGTAAPANLLPFPSQQPLRLFDRGLNTEHYGFYTFYNRSIFLKSNTPLNGSNLGDGEIPDDENGGSTESEATVRCTWSETRFLIQIWTRKGSTSALLGNATSSTSSLESSSLTANTTANYFTRPGSFPYPVTITTDRHGGDPSKKLVYCYALDTREENIAGSGKVQLEQRFFGGVTINPAPSTFSNTSDPSLGGFDGGSGGCKCQWQNWKSVIHT